MSELKIPVTATDHIQGDENAPVILVEYGDYECPHCGRAYPIVDGIPVLIAGQEQGMGTRE